MNSDPQRKISLSRLCQQMNKTSLNYKQPGITETFISIHSTSYLAYQKQFSNLSFMHYDQIIETLPRLALEE